MKSTAITRSPSGQAFEVGILAANSARNRAVPAVLCTKLLDAAVCIG